MEFLLAVMLAVIGGAMIGWVVCSLMYAREEDEESSLEFPEDDDILLPIVLGIDKEEEGEDEWTD